MSSVKQQNLFSFFSFPSFQFLFFFFQALGGGGANVKLKQGKYKIRRNIVNPWYFALSFTINGELLKNTLSLGIEQLASGGIINI